MNNAFSKINGWIENGQKVCLWIGRAKLPHVGHIAYLKALHDLGYKLVIANGSCYTLDPRNPIHAFQIQVMLGLSLMNEGLREDDFTFIPLPDFDKDEDWRNYLTAMPHFDKISAIATGNDWVLSALADKISGATIIGLDLVKPAIPISALLGMMFLRCRPNVRAEPWRASVSSAPSAPARVREQCEIETPNRS